LNFNL